MPLRLGISTGACANMPIHDALDAIAAAGVTAVEISTPPRHFDPMSTDAVAALARSLAGHRLEAVAIHAPFGGLLDLAEPNPHHRVAAIGAILTAAAAIKNLGGRIVVVHPSDLERARHDAASRLADCARSLRDLGESCRQEGLTLAVETPLPHLVGGHPDEFRWLLSQIDPATRVCLDTGHTTLGGHWRDFVNVADGRAIHVHAHDNHGHRDDHLPPGDGRIDWQEIVRTLAAASFDGCFMLELGCPRDGLAPYFQRAVANARRLESTAGAIFSG
jgi:sugar phosphate isomerase/epimerase